MTLFIGNQDKGLGVLYRYTSYYHGSNMTLSCYSYPIVKVTPKGNWIEVFGLGLKNDRKFINKEAKKQWASKTESKALRAFYYRKIRQIKILTANLKNAKDAFLEAKIRIENDY